MSARDDWNAVREFLKPEVLDDPAHAARVRIAARALGDALATENYEQRARAVLAVAFALRVNVRVMSNTEPRSSDEQHVERSQCAATLADGARCRLDAGHAAWRHETDDGRTFDHTEAKL